MPDVHRLKDIEVEEVSLVDRAANKRKFLLVKRDGEGTMDRIVADGEGGFRRVTKAEEAEEETAKAKAPPFPPKKPDDEKDDDDEKKPGAKKPPPFGKKPATKADAEDVAIIDDVVEILSEALDALDELRGAEEAEPAEGSAKAKAKKAVEKGRALLAARKTAATAPPAKDAAVAKSGAKISRARMDRLKNALALIDGVLKEVDTSPDDEKDKAAKAATEATVDEDLKKSISALVDVAQKQLETNEALTKENASLTKRLDEQEKTIAQIRKSVPAPNSVNPESPRATQRKSDEVVWPQNMNPKRSSRIAKGGGDKDESFLDD